MTGVQHVDWRLLWPVLGPGLAALAVLVLDAVLPRALLARRGRLLLDLTAGAGLVAGVVTLLPLAGEHDATFCTSGGCSYAVEPVTTGLQLVILVAAGLCLLLAIGSGSGSGTNVPGASGPPRTEAHLLLLAATAGAVAVAGARDLATVLVALETASLPVVGLVALRRDGRGAEAALKLLLTSVVSVAVLVLGIALIYAACGTLYLGPVGGLGSLQPVTADARALAALGLAFVIAGVAFKVSAVPFQLWTPDTYAGAPLPVAAFLAAVSKAAALAALVAVLAAGGPLLGRAWAPLVGGLAVLSMTVGNLVALRQDRAVRLLAWSTVAQAGWVLLPFAGVGPSGGLSFEASGAAIAYLAAYALVTLLAFAVVAVVARSAAEGEGHLLRAYDGLGRSRPVLAGALAFALLALAGLPPGVLGLVAKVLALRPVVAGGSWFVAAVAVANVALGIVVYLRWGLRLVTRPVAAASAASAGEAAGAAAGDATGSGGAGSRGPGVAGSRASAPEIAVLALAGSLAVLASVAPQLLATFADGLGR